MSRPLPSSPCWLAIGLAPAPVGQGLDGWVLPLPVPITWGSRGGLACKATSAHDAEAERCASMRAQAMACRHTSIGWLGVVPGDASALRSGGGHQFRCMAQGWIPTSEHPPKFERAARVI